MIVKSMIWTILFSLAMAACAGAAQPTATPAEPKSPSMTSTRPPATRTATVPQPTKTPPRTNDTEPSPLEPLPDEQDLVHGEVFVDEFEILLMESDPVQVSLLVSGTLPTPCHTLRASVSEPDENGRIDVELWSLTKPGVACIQVLESFKTSIPLGSFTSGSYTVYVDGEKVGEFSV